MKQLLIFATSWIAVLCNLHASCPELKVIGYGINTMISKEQDRKFFSKGLTEEWAKELSSEFAFADDFEDLSKGISSLYDELYFQSKNPDYDKLPIALTRREGASSDFCSYNLVLASGEKFLMSFTTKAR